ncbi:MAG TPA: metalloregulator ArsR/SmtB family transcription factor [Phycisphaerales bacterium]|nr:metalloregulator ArsR/SmtB family transcription factor [Phycisphaerales bacterium]
MLPDLAFIAQPTRQQILRLIWESERSAGDIAEAVPVTFGAVSQHLGALRKAGLVRLRREGRMHWYAAEREAFGALGPALEEMWFGKLGELKRLAEAEQRRIDRAKTN